MNEGDHRASAYMSDIVRKVCLNCTYEKCISEKRGCKKYKQAVREASAETKHKWIKKED